MRLRLLIKTLFVLYTLSVLEFFQPLNMIEPELAKAISYAAMVSIFGLAIVCDTKEQHVISFKRNVKGLLCMMLISIVMPTISYFDQSLVTTFIATLPYFSFGLYFAMRKFGIERSFYYKLIFSIVTISIITHAINLRSFPLIVFGELQDDYELDRGGLRLVIQGFNFIILGFFIAAGEFMRAKRLRWIPLLIICFSMIFLSYTRQHIVACTLLGLWILLRSCGGRMRQVVIGVVAVATLAYVLPKIPIVKMLVNVTIEQHERNEAANRENVRVVAARYYGWEAFESPLNRVFGNGVPSYHSKWGMEVKAHADMENLYTLDVGWFGFNWYFGIVAVVFMLTICGKAILPRYNPKSNNGRYYFVWLFVTGFMSGSLLYNYEIIVTIIALCIIDCDNEEYMHTPTLKRPMSQTVVPTTFGSDVFSWTQIKPKELDDTENGA